MIQFSNVTKSFGEHFALDNIRLRVGRGELCFLCGPSGSGKSTIINMILGTEKPTEGNILVNNRNVPRLQGNALAEHLRHIGMVFQDYRLIDRLSAYDNIALVLRICGISNVKEIDRRIQAVAQLLGIRSLLNANVHRLSGGEKQRVAIARALVHHPPLLIADEPTGNLDPRQTQDIFRIFTKIQEMGTTVFVATHDLDMVQQSGRAAYEIAGGVVRYVVSP